MRRLSIRGKFALWAAALVALVLLVFSAGTFVNLYHEQLEAVDLELKAQLRHVSSLSGPEVMTRTLDELVHFQPWMGIAVFSREGHLVRRSPNLPEPLARDALSRPEVHTSSGPLIQRWRLVSFSHANSTVVLAHELSEVHEIVTDLLLSYLVSLPFVALLAAAGAWWVTGRALTPLRELTRAAESIRADQLSRRVPVHETADEVDRLGSVFNAMIARLELSFQQAQRFAADASHELRTPLTIMHGEIERMLRTPGLNSASETQLVSLQEEISRLNRITEHLLLLAGFDAGNATIGRERVDLSTLVTTTCEDADLLAAAQQVELSTAIAPNISVTGDDVHLRRVVLSLLDNATRYNHPMGKVHCTLASRGATVELRVRNTGAGIPAARRPQLFERFFRVDTARGNGGHGLGLSLSREIVLAHGGAINLNDTAPEGWTEFVVTLPEIRSEEGRRADPKNIHNTRT
jgi:two-component system, OmpR family, heavy metal sensor histidine kinase CusS